jgi:hypothetical protein
MGRTVITIDDTDDNGGILTHAEFERSMADIDHDPTPAEEAAVALMACDEAELLLGEKTYADNRGELSVVVSEESEEDSEAV